MRAKFIIYSGCEPHINPKEPIVFAIPGMALMGYFKRKSETEYEPIAEGFNLHTDPVAIQSVQSEFDKKYPHKEEILVSGSQVENDILIERARTVVKDRETLEASCEKLGVLISAGIGVKVTE